MNDNKAVAIRLEVVSESILIQQYNGLSEDIKVAINALEKQIPKKIDIQQYIYTKCDCGFEFSKHVDDGFYTIPREKKTNYCPNCGQKLDWSVEE